ncbi:MAG: glycosyltransferase [Stagnimonas sp.]|nr:glycosyltransferase [Stagnimonas sp.]
MSLAVAGDGRGTVSVCLATYHRNDQLALLLADLAAQTRPPDEVVVVDNDAAGSAEATINRCRAVMPFPIQYEVQPVQNISRTRNRTVALARGDWLAIIDDDERAPPHWLAELLATTQAADADGVLGPVHCIVPAEAPAWIRRGDFYATRHHPTGQTFPLDRISKGNALLRASRVKALEGPYDESLGLSGGEDGDLYCRFVNAGGKLVWCEEALLSEPVEPSRLKARWLLLRALRGGQDYARHWRSGHYQPVQMLDVPVFVLRAFAQWLLALLLGVLLLPLGLHRAMPWLVKAAANIGKLSAFWGARYGEYAAPPAPLKGGKA